MAVRTSLATKARTTQAEHQVPSRGHTVGKEIRWMDLIHGHSSTDAASSALATAKHTYGCAAGMTMLL